MQPSSNHAILVTGATGYVGGRLWRRLEADGRRVRCLARRPAELASRVGVATEVVGGDVLDAESLGPALAGVESAYYLIHSMGSGRDFEEQDRTAARNFGSAARRAGVRRIVYLGGLGHGQDLSPHLRSRQEVGDILRESGVPVLELRASIVIGSGSLSFEMIRALVERLPVMITPRWVEVEAQPIAVDDLLGYLVAALDVPLTASRVFEIGGADRVTYGDLMREYARQRGLRRAMIRVPVLTPWLSSLWLGLVTPLYARVGRKLAESIKHPTVVRDRSALEAFPVRPRGIREAIAAAIRNEEREIAESRWYDAYSSGGAGRDSSGMRFGSRLVDSRTRAVDVAPEAAFAPIRRIGGATGWYAYDWLWRLRGFLDLLAGGVGVRRGRPAPEELHVGDALDFWRVEAYEPGRRLRLAAEMRLPGRAWLELEVVPREGGATIRQTALFDPVGLLGRVYWYGVYPLHRLVFAGLLGGIARAATGRPPAEALMMRRLLLLCGVLSPLLYAVADALAGLRWDGYSFRDQTISELGALGAPSRPLFATLLVAVDLLFVAFGVGIWRSAQNRPRLRVAAGLSIAFGVLALTVGQLAPMHLRGTEQGLSGALHLIEGAAAMVLLVAAMGFAAAALGRSFAVYTAGTVAIMLWFGGWGATEIAQVEAGVPTPWLGVKERIFWYSYQLWFIALALKLLREPKP